MRFIHEMLDLDAKLPWHLGVVWVKLVLDRCLVRYNGWMSPVGLLYSNEIGH